MRSFVERSWLSIVWPAGACLRGATAFAILGATFIGVEVSKVVASAVSVALVAYALLYLAVWAKRVDRVVVAYAVLVDALLVGLLVSGSGPQLKTVGLLVLLVLANAHISAGIVLTAIAAGVAGVAWGCGWLLSLGPFVSAPGARFAFTTALEIETTYHGLPVGADLGVFQPVAALATLLAISAAGGVAVWRALREQRRVAAAYRHVECLEAIVDLATGERTEEDFWQGVLQSAAALTGARVYPVYAAGGVLQVRSPGGVIAGAETEQTGEWVLRSIRVPLSAKDNLLVRAMEQEMEAETADVGDICRASEREVAPDVMERLRSSWGVRFVIVPVSAGRAKNLLVAAVPQVTDRVRRGLRAVAERAAAVWRAIRQRDDAVTQPMPAGANA